MKKFLLLSSLAVSLLYSNVFAQCTISNPTIVYNSVTPVAGFPDSCDVRFSFRFNFTHNNGNKDVYIHFWDAANYPSPGINYSLAAPTAANLAQSAGTIRINNPGATSTLLNSYFVPGVKMLYTGITKTYTAGSPELYVLNNIVIRVRCSPAIVIQGDIWGTQGGNTPSCYDENFEFTTIGILPVKLVSFNAVRQGKYISLEWKTAEEINNAGFDIQRINLDGTIETVARLSSQAANGNSVAPLTYTFKDLNTSVASTQYRIRQENKDGKLEFSPVRKVDGVAGNSRVYVYPNPATGKNLAIMFDEAAGEKQISLLDNAGRIVTKLSSSNTQKLEMPAPAAGVYHLLVYFIATGEKSVTKLLVQP